MPNRGPTNVSPGRSCDTENRLHCGHDQTGIALERGSGVFFVVFVRGLPGRKKRSGSARSTRHKIRVSDGRDNGVSRTEPVRQCFEFVPQRLVVIAVAKPFLAEPLPSEVEHDTAATTGVGSGSQCGRTGFYPKFLQPSVFRDRFEQLFSVDGIAADLQLIDDCR